MDRRWLPSGQVAEKLRIYRLATGTIEQRRVHSEGTGTVEVTAPTVADEQNSLGRHPQSVADLLVDRGIGLDGSHFVAEDEVADGR